MHSHSKIADIMSLNYLVKGKEVTKFQKNETISIKFKRQVRNTKHGVSFPDIESPYHMYCHSLTTIYKRKMHIINIAGRSLPGI